MDRKYQTKLDFQFNCKNSIITFKDIDSNTSDFYIKITRGGKVVNIENALASLVVIKPNKSIEAQFIEVKNGELYANLEPSMKDLEGVYNASLMLVLEKEKIVLDGINYKVEGTIITQLEEEVKENDKFILLTQMLERLSTIELNEDNREDNFNNIKNEFSIMKNEFNSLVTTQTNNRVDEIIKPIVDNRVDSLTIPTLNILDNKINIVNSKIDEVEVFIEDKELLINNVISKVENDIDITIEEANNNIDEAIAKIPPKDELIGPKGNKGDKGDTPSISHLEKQVSDKSKELDTKFNTLTAKQQQDAEVVTARDGEVSLHARLERDLENISDQLATNTGNINAEIVDARVKNDGTSYSKLGDRLDAVDSQLVHIENIYRSFFNVKEFVCDDGIYVQGDGVHDDTSGIQKALDEAKGKLFFPQGVYKVSGDNHNILTLNKNIDIEFENVRNTIILASSNSNGTNVFNISIKDNYGQQDVRNWNLKNINIQIAKGCKNSLIFDDCLPMLTCNIENISVQATNNGYGLYINAPLSHSKIQNSTIESCYCENIYDANVFEKNMFMGIKTGITINTEEGVYNNTIINNTFACRDGAVHIINADAIRIENNQIEQFQAYGENQFSKSCMIYIEGRNRVCFNNIIEKNNLGGGTNLNHLIYIDNGQRCVISKNQLIPVNIADIYLGEQSKYCIIENNNTCRSPLGNPRPNTDIKNEIIDKGLGNFGTIRSDLELENSWVGGKRFTKNTSGLVSFLQGINAGTLNPGDKIGVIPNGYRPYDFTNIMCVTANGVGYIKHTTGGNIFVGYLPSNTDVIIQPFFSPQQEI